MDAREYVDSVHSNAARVDTNAAVLERISDALELVGNRQLSEDILGIAMDLRTTSKHLRDSLSEKLTYDVSQSHKTSETILKAALAGASLANTSKKPSDSKGPD